MTDLLHIYFAQPHPAPLTTGERRLLVALSNGRGIDFRAGDPSNDDPGAGASWGDERAISGRLLRWVLSDARARDACRANRIGVGGARVYDPLDLSHLEVAKPLIFLDCHFDEDINVGGASLDWVTFEGSRMRSLYATGASCRADFDISRVHATGLVLLGGMRVAQTVYASGAHLEATEAKERIALSLDRAHIGGAVFLNDGFVAEGEVRIRDAEIGGGFTCGSATLRNPNGDALSMEGTTVRGNVFLDNGFHTIGAVHLTGVRISGQLVCRGGLFEHPDGDAIDLDRAVVDGPVFLNQGFHARGGVRMLGARIGGQLSCGGGRFTRPGKDALSLDRASIADNVYMNGGFAVEGSVRLFGTRIGGQLYAEHARIENAGGLAFVASGAVIGNNLWLGEGFHAIGDVQMLGGHVHGNCGLNGARVDGDVILAKSTFERDCLIYDSAIAANVMLRGAQVTGTLRLAAEGGGFLDLAHAQVGVLDDDARWWPKPGGLIVEGLRLGRFADMSPQSARHRLAWLRRQDRDGGRASWTPYDEVARVLENAGDRDGATAVRIGKEADLIRHGNLTRVSRAIRRVWGATTGFGHAPGRIFLWMIPVLMFGAALFQWAWTASIMAPSASDVLASDWYQPLTRAGRLARLTNDYPAFDAVVYSLDAFLPIIDLHQESFWLPTTAVRFGWVVRAYLWVHIVLGWLLSSIGVAGLSKWVRTSG